MSFLKEKFQSSEITNISEITKSDLFYFLSNPKGFEKTYSKNAIAKLEEMMTIKQYVRYCKQKSRLGHYNFIYNFY